jgi:vancomycin permeability regulator SanA
MVGVIPLVQMAGAAGADYVRPADSVVVLGARVYSSGAPSLALADRMATGCDLMNRHLASTLIVSGGPGDGDVHETDTMRRLAIDCGVSPDAIVVDREGLSTADTAHNVARYLHESGSGRRARVLVVSHDYHLARARMALADQGVGALTVPAKQSRSLPKMPWFIAREVAGFWAYFAAGSALAA